MLKTKISYKNLKIVATSRNKSGTPFYCQNFKIFPVLEETPSVKTLGTTLLFSCSFRQKSCQIMDFCLDPPLIISRKSILLVRDISLSMPNHLLQLCHNHACFCFACMLATLDSFLITLSINPNGENSCQRARSSASVPMLYTNKV